MTATCCSRIALYLTLMACASPAFPQTDVAYQVRHPLGVTAHVVIVDLNSRSISVDVALPRGGVGASESFSSIVARAKPVAAITGTFFCTRSLVPVGDIVVSGRRVHNGAIGSGILFTCDNRMRVVRAEKGKAVDWTDCVTGVRAGPLLLSNGEVSVDAYREGFRDKGLFGRRVRAAIGVTQHNKLLLVAVRMPVTLTELAKVMRALGSVEAINMDGGSSTGLSFRNKMLVRPGRRMTNLITVTRRADSVLAERRNNTTTKTYLLKASPDTPLPDGICAPPSDMWKPVSDDRQMQTVEQFALLPQGPSRRETR